jgi:CDP-diacylglycerol pyrophosphatase
MYSVPFNMQQDSQTLRGQSQALPMLQQKCHKRLHSPSFFNRHSSPRSFCTWNARIPIQTYSTAATISNAKAAFQQLQIFICVRYANVSRLTPVNSWPDTYWLQLPLTFAADPYSCTAVSIRVVSHSTNSMKAPRMMAPGRSCRRPARTSMARRKRRERLAVTIANGNSLH